jgi:hypothetical protein
LGEVVEDLVNIDVRGGFFGEQVANNTGRVESRRVIEVPEGELLSLDERRQFLGLALVAKDLVESVDQTLRSESLSRGVLNVENRRLCVKFTRESDSSQDITVESRLGSLILNSEFVFDLTKDGDCTSRSRDGLDESLLNEGAVDSHVDDTNLGAISRELGQNLLSHL